MITIKRIPTEPETYEVWLIPESVGFDARSFDVRGAVRAKAEDLIACEPCDRLREIAERDREARNATEQECDRFRSAMASVDRALTEAGMAAHGTLAERVDRLRDERESLRADLRGAERERERFLAMLRPAR